MSRLQAVDAANAGQLWQIALTQQLAADLKNGKLDLPSFPDVVLRIRKLLADEKSTASEIAAVVGSEPALAADVLMHVGWHHLAHEALRPSAEASLLGESIASAFDLYLVGRLLGHRPESAFLESQVPRMLESALAAGGSEEDLERVLAFASESPERAFEELRQLLFDASCALSHPLSPEAASETLTRFDGQRMGCLLHHYELSTWVLRARIERLEARIETTEHPSRSTKATGRDALELDRELRAAPDSIALLERLWVEPALART